MKRQSAVNSNFIVNGKFDPTAFGDRVRRRREELGYQQAELAAKIGGYGSKLSLWENGVRPPSNAEALVALADALECSVDYLLTGRTPPGVEELIAELEYVLAAARGLRIGSVVLHTGGTPADGERGAKLEEPDIPAPRASNPKRVAEGDQ